MSNDALPHYKIYAATTYHAAKLAADMDLHLSQWHWEELYINITDAFAEEDGTTEEKRY